MSLLTQETALFRSANYKIWSFAKNKIYFLFNFGFDSTENLYLQKSELKSSFKNNPVSTESYRLHPGMW